MAIGFDPSTAILALNDKDESFDEWKLKNAPEDTGEDYDLAGAFNANLHPAENGHFPDTFKKPNHPTFSKESIYSTDDQTGGEWGTDDQGRDTFKPSPWMGSDPARQERLKSYFKEKEPNSTLIDSDPYEKPFDPSTAIPREEFIANLVKDGTFDPANYKNFGVSKEDAFEVRQKKKDRTLVEKTKAFASGISGSTFAEAAKGVAKFIGGLAVMSGEGNVQVIAPQVSSVLKILGYNALAKNVDNELLSERAELALGASHGEEAVKSLGRNIGEFSGDISHWVFGGPRDDAKERADFDEDIAAVDREQQLHKGKFIEGSIVSKIAKAGSDMFGEGKDIESTLGAKHLEEEGARKANELVVEMLSAGMDPVNIALLATSLFTGGATGIAGKAAAALAEAGVAGRVASGVIRGAMATSSGIAYIPKLVANTATRTLGAAASFPFKIIRAIPSRLGRITRIGETGITAGLAVEAAMHPALVAKAAGIAGIARLFDLIGKGLAAAGETTGKFGVTNLDQQILTGFRAGESNLLLKGSRALGQGVHKFIEVPIEFAPFNLASSGGDPNKFADMSIGAGMFGGIFATKAQFRSSAQKALNANAHGVRMIEHGAKNLGGVHPEIFAMHQSNLFMFPDEIRNEIQKSRSLSNGGLLTDILVLTPEQADHINANKEKYKFEIPNDFNRTSGVHQAEHRRILINTGSLHIGTQYHEIGHAILDSINKGVETAHGQAVIEMLENSMSPEEKRKAAEDYLAALYPAGIPKSEIEKLDANKNEHLSESLSEISRSLLRGQDLARYGFSQESNRIITNKFGKILHGIARTMGMGLTQMDFGSFDMKVDISGKKGPQYGQIWNQEVAKAINSILHEVGQRADRNMRGVSTDADREFYQKMRERPPVPPKDPEADPDLVPAPKPEPEGPEPILESIPKPEPEPIPKIGHLTQQQIVDAAASDPANPIGAVIDAHKKNEEDNEGGFTVQDHEDAKGNPFRTVDGVLIKGDPFSEYLLDQVQVGNDGRALTQEERDIITGLNTGGVNGFVYGHAGTLSNPVINAARRREQILNPAKARIEDEALRQKEQKRALFVNAVFNERSRTITLQMLSVDKLNNNYKNLVESINIANERGANIVNPYASEAEVVADLKSYAENYKNNYLGDGAGVAKDANGVPLVPSGTPIPIPNERFDFINLLLANESTKNKTPLGLARRRIAEANGIDLGTDRESNPLRRQLNAALGPKWSSRTLESPHEILRPELISEINGDITSVGGLRNVGPEFNEAFDKGIPDENMVAGNYMPEDDSSLNSEEITLGDKNVSYISSNKKAKEKKPKEKTEWKAGEDSLMEYEGEREQIAAVLTARFTNGLDNPNLLGPLKNLIKKYPQYLNGPLDHIVKSAVRLKLGEITHRELAKAYIMTIVSQGAGAVSLDALQRSLVNYNDKMKREGKPQIKFKINPSKIFLHTNKKGKIDVRPEEIAAYWITTKDGKKALDNLDYYAAGLTPKGLKPVEGATNPNLMPAKYRPEDFAIVKLLREFYGDDRVAGSGMMIGNEWAEGQETIRESRPSWEKEPFPSKASKRDNYGYKIQAKNEDGTLKLDWSEKKIGEVTLSNLNDALLEINENKGNNVQGMINIFLKFKGIDSAKAPFIGHFIGFGQRVTLDAVEKNYEIGGTGDSRNFAKDQQEAPYKAKKNPTPDEKKEIEKIRAEIKAKNDAVKLPFRKELEVLSGSSELQELAREFIENKIDQIKAERLAKNSNDPIGKIPNEAFFHIMHHWIWDAAKGIKTTHKGLYKSMDPKYMPSEEGNLYFDKDSKIQLTHYGSRQILDKLQPNRGEVPKTDRITSGFVNGNTLSENELYSIQENYSKWARRSGMAPTDLIQHIGNGNASVWSAYGTNDKFVGQFIGDAFVVSHFAPEGGKSAIGGLMDLLHTQTPVVFAVPDRIAGQLERLGFRRSKLVIPMMFKGEVMQKNLLANNAVTGSDTQKLAAWWVAESSLNGLFEKIGGSDLLDSAKEGINQLQLDSKDASYMPFAGEGATGFAEAEKKGDVFVNPFDFMKRFEISDDKMKSKNAWDTLTNSTLSSKITIGDLYDHEELFKSYPWLRDVPVIKDPNLKGRGSAREDNRIRIGDQFLKDIFIAKDKNPSADISIAEHYLKKTMIHEIQHLIQFREKFPRGASTSQHLLLQRLDDIEKSKIKQIDRAEQKFNSISHNNLNKLKAKKIDADLIILNKDLLEWQKYYFDNFGYKNGKFTKQLSSQQLFDLYFSATGEMEARMASDRSEFSDDHRKQNPAIYQNQAHPFLNFYRDFPYPQWDAIHDAKIAGVNAQKLGVDRYMPSDEVAGKPYNRKHDITIRAMLRNAQNQKRDLTAEEKLKINDLVGKNLPVDQVSTKDVLASMASQEKVNSAIDSKQKLSNQFDYSGNSIASPWDKVDFDQKATGRQDVPSMTRHNTGVVTIAQKGPDGKLSSIYVPFALFEDNPRLAAPQTEKIKGIGAGDAKSPDLGVISGKLSRTQKIPDDIESWTQVGFNPDRHSYFYLKSDQTKGVTGGEKIVQIGNTVFVKNPVFATPEEQAFYKYMPFAGEGATGFAEAEKRGGVFINPNDFMKRFEISDDKMKSKDAWGKLNADRRGVRNYKVGDLYDHPELFKNYPWIANIPVEVTVSNDESHASADIYNNKINVEFGYLQNLFETEYRKDNRTTPEMWEKMDLDLKKTIIHEIQHFIQFKEGFAQGGRSEEEFLRKTLQIIRKSKSDQIRRTQYIETGPRSHRTATDPKRLEDLRVLQKDLDAWDEYYKKNYNFEIGFSNAGVFNGRLSETQRHKLYRSISGEIEARMAASRSELTDKQRLKQSPLGGRNSKYLITTFDNPNDALFSDINAQKLGVDRYMPFAGEGATGFAEAEKRGDVFVNPFDFMKRFEISDDKMKSKDAWQKLYHDSFGKATLADLYDHQELFRNYPWLKDIPVEVDFTKDATFDGRVIFSGPKHSDIRIQIHNNYLVDLLSKRTIFPEKNKFKIANILLKELFVHEIQHLIQFEEGFSGGGNTTKAFLLDKIYNVTIAKKSLLAKALEEYNFGKKDKAVVQKDIDTITDDLRNWNRYLEKNYDYLSGIFGNPTKEMLYNLYRTISGEMEANLAQNRTHATPKERKQYPPIYEKQEFPLVNFEGFDDVVKSKKMKYAFEQRLKVDRYMPLDELAEEMNIPRTLSEDYNGKQINSIMADHMEAYNFKERAMARLLGQPVSSGGQGYAIKNHGTGVVWASEPDMVTGMLGNLNRRGGKFQEKGKQEENDDWFVLVAPFTMKRDALASNNEFAKYRINQLKQWAALNPDKYESFKKDIIKWSNTLKKPEAKAGTKNYGVIKYPFYKEFDLNNFNFSTNSEGGSTFTQRKDLIQEIKRLEDKYEMPSTDELVHHSGDPFLYGVAQRTMLKAEKAMFHSVVIKINLSANERAWAIQKYRFKQGPEEIEEVKKAFKDDNFDFSKININNPFNPKAQYKGTNAEEYGVDAHASYGRVILGDTVAMLRNPIRFDSIFPDLLERFKKFHISISEYRKLNNLNKAPLNISGWMGMNPMGNTVDEASPKFRIEKDSDGVLKAKSVIDKTLPLSISGQVLTKELISKINEEQSDEKISDYKKASEKYNKDKSKDFQERNATISLNSVITDIEKLKLAASSLDEKQAKKINEDYLKASKKLAIPNFFKERAQQRIDEAAKIVADKAKRDANKIANKAKRDAKKATANTTVEAP